MNIFTEYEYISFPSAVRIFYLNVLKREGLMMVCNKLNRVA